MRTAAFLDRDGTIVDQSSGFLNNVDQMRAVDFLPGAIDALRRLAEIGYQLHIVTNQGGVGAGFLSETVLCEMHLVLYDRLQQEGVKISSIKSCTHKPDSGCECRKPKPGMLLSLAERFQIDLPNSIMIGNDATDVAAGVAAGCKSYLLTRWQDLDLSTPTVPV